MLLAAVKYTETHQVPIDEADFDKQCGIGALRSLKPWIFFHSPSDFSITPAEFTTLIANYITTNAVSGWANLGPVISALKNTPELRWANPLEVKNAAEKAFVDNFGPKEAEKPKGKASMNTASEAYHVLTPQTGT